VAAVPVVVPVVLAVVSVVVPVVVPVVSVVVPVVLAVVSVVVPVVLAVVGPHVTPVPLNVGALVCANAGPASSAAAATVNRSFLIVQILRLGVFHKGRIREA
jgi:hypothetical protein